MTAVARLRALRDRLRALSGWQRASVLVSAGLASVLAFAPFFVWPVLFLTLPVLYWLITPQSPEIVSRAILRRAFVDGWWFGFGYFFAGLFWVGEAFLVEADIFGWLLPFAVTLLPAGLALFFGSAAAISRVLWRPGLAGLLITAVVFAGAEWLRGHLLTGFPWNVLGYALTSSECLMQSAGLVGIYGLTLWAVLIFLAPLVLAADADSDASSFAAIAPGLALAIVPLSLAAIYGAAVLASASRAARRCTPRAHRPAECSAAREVAPRQAGRNLPPPSRSHAPQPRWSRRRLQRDCTDRLAGSRDAFSPARTSRSAAGHR